MHELAASETDCVYLKASLRSDESGGLFHKVVACFDVAASSVKCSELTVDIEGHLQGC